MSKSSKAQGLFVILLLFANLAMAQMACISDCSHPDTRRLCKRCVKENNIKRQNNLDAGKQQEQSYRESRSAKEGFNAEECYWPDAENTKAVAEAEWSDAQAMRREFKTKPGFNADSSLFTDKRDSIVYRVIKHKNRFWMAENLAYNGHEHNVFGLVKVGEKPYAGKGLVYNYQEAVKACPAGWRLPSKKDWQTFVGTKNPFVPYDLKSKCGWGIDKTDTLKDSRGNKYLRIKQVNGYDTFGMSMEPYFPYEGGMKNSSFFTDVKSVEFGFSVQDHDAGGFSEPGYGNSMAAQIRCIYGGK